MDNLTGAWAAYDPPAVYDIRHLEDNTLWWAGLHSDGFHRGLRFTNVFRGVVTLRRGVDNTGAATVEGLWVDVPRGRNLQQGRLSLDIVESPPPDNDDIARMPRAAPRIDAC